MKIVIPSHNRVDSVKPLEWIPESFHENVYIITRKGEQEESYQTKYGDKVNVLGLKCHDIGTKRDAIARYFKCEKIWMIDDDCILRNTKVTEDKDYLQYGEIVNEEDFYRFIEYTSELLDTYPHGVVNPKIFPVKPKLLPYRLNKWAFTNAFLNLSMVDADLLEYTFVDHSEDLVAFLNVIDAGYDSFHILNWLIQSDKPGKPGGMTEVRNKEMMDNSKRKILEKFPEHIYLKKKQYQTGGHNSSISLVVRPNVKKRKNNRNLKQLF